MVVYCLPHLDWVLQISQDGSHHLSVPSVPLCFKILGATRGRQEWKHRGTEDTEPLSQRAMISVTESEPHDPPTFRYDSAPTSRLLLALAL
jgi:hypothetical protein